METAKERSESVERTRALRCGANNNDGDVSDAEKLQEEEVMSLAQAALNDCNEVLRMDCKCAQGYALRSQLQLMFYGGGGDGNNALELDYTGNHSSNSNSNNNLNDINSGESAVLAAAAKDALAAYLVGGSTDLRST